jgi:hypothetical protein
MPIDWEAADRWQAGILRDDLGEIRTGFAENGAGGPDIVWAPARDRVRSGENRFLLDYWHESRGGAALPPMSAVDPMRIKPALGRVGVLEPVDGGRDFRYRLFGTIMAAVSGFDLTGKLLSTHPSSAHVVTLTLALYRATLAKQAPVLSSYAPVARYVAFWERLMLPFAGADGSVARILTGNAAFDRDGRQLQS